MSTTIDNSELETPEHEEREAEALDAYSRVVVDVAERLAPSVANLRVMRRSRVGQVPAGAGSAVALTPDGFLLTSAHVVAGPGRTGRAAFVDGRELSFSVVGIDRLSDLAVLRVDGDQLVPATLGEAERPARRPAGGRDRQPERVRRLGDGRRRLGARPVAARSGGTDGPLHRQRDPDRCGAESGQLGRSAGRQRGAGGRDQHGRRRGRARAGGTDQRGHAPDHRRADERRAGASRVHRDRRRPPAAASPRPRATGTRAAASRWSRWPPEVRPSAPGCGPRT